MDKLGLFTTLIILFVLYQFLSTIYNYGRRRLREGTRSICGPGCDCKGNCKGGCNGDCKGGCNGNCK